METSSSTLNPMTQGFRKLTRFAALFWGICVAMQLLFLWVALTSNLISAFKESNGDSLPFQIILLDALSWWSIPISFALDVAFFWLLNWLFLGLARRYWLGWAFVPAVFYMSIASIALLFMDWAMNQSFYLK